MHVENTYTMEEAQRIRHAVEGLMITMLRRRIGQDIRDVPSGIEHWEATPTGPFVTRFLDTGWVTRTAAQAGAPVKSRRAGELTTLFNRVPSWAQPLVHD